MSILRSGVLQALAALWAGAAWAQLVISESPSAAKLSFVAGQVMIESPEYPRGLWLHLVDEAGQALAGIQVDYHGLPNGLVALHCVDPAGLRREMLLWTLPQGDPLRLTLQPRGPADLPAGLVPIDWQIAPAAEALLEPVAETQLTGWEPVEAFLRTRWQGRSGRVAVQMDASASLAVDLDHPEAVGMLLAYLQQLYQLEGITLGKGTRLNVQVYKGSPALVEGVTLFIAYFFEDAALEAAVRRQLRRPQGPITRQDVASLTNLNFASNKAIHNLSGLEHFTALRRLELDNNQLVDVSPLSALTNLQWLFLDNNQLVDVSPLSALTNLQSLDLRNNQLVDVSPLSALTKLEQLYLDNNQLVDVSPLSLTNLQWLFLDNNQLVDVSPLSALTNLQWLFLDNNQLVDVSPLSTLTNLQWLYLRNNQLVDVSPLSTLTNLQSLSLNNNQLVDVSPLSTLTNLQSLSLNNNQLVDVSPLSTLTNLQSLSLRNNQLVDVSPLSALANLRWLDLRNIQLVDVSPLSALTNLQWLFLDNNQLVDVSPLLTLTNLRRLFLRGNPLSDEARTEHIPALNARGVSVQF